MRVTRHPNFAFLRRSFQFCAGLQRKKDQKNSEFGQTAGGPEKEDDKNFFEKFMDKF